MQLQGDLILFAPEGAPGDSWCGQPGRTCLDCTHDVVGSDATSKCSTRMTSQTLAVKLDRLAHWVQHDWPDRT